MNCLFLCDAPRTISVPEVCHGGLLPVMSFMGVNSSQAASIKQFAKLICRLCYSCSLLSWLRGLLPAFKLASSRAALLCSLLCPLHKAEWLREAAEVRARKQSQHLHLRAKWRMSCVLATTCITTVGNRIAKFTTSDSNSFLSLASSTVPFSSHIPSGNMFIRSDAAFSAQANTAKASKQR